MTDEPRHVRAYKIRVGYTYDEEPAAIRADLEPVLGSALVGVTTEGTEPATAVILVEAPHRRGTPTVHHGGERLDIPDAVDRAGFVYRRAVPAAEYRDALAD